MEPLNKSIPILLKDAHISDPFWSTYINLVRDVVIPYQWEALNDRIPNAEPSYAIKNFRIAAGIEEGTYKGVVFLDSDLAKWLEAVGYSLQTSPNADLEKIADDAIDLIEAAQHKDGYLNTYFTVKEPGNRWTNLHECHELYCAGHMLEAAVAYFHSTGKRKLLEVMIRYINYIDTIFGPEEGKLKGYPGHQEIELALVKLYQVTSDNKYLKLSQYFIDERGTKPYYFDLEWEKRGKMSHWAGKEVSAPSLSAAYNQAHLPVREQSVAVGHAVRAVYMYSAMADLARENEDATLFDACKKLWSNIVEKQLYINGSIGSTVQGEAFTFDYDLPNDTIYAETCASIGLIFFAHRMLQIDPDRMYADVIENALFNNVLASMAKDGKHFFYVNPLEVWPEASHKNPGKTHVKEERQSWFGCACCPPNVARLLSSLGEYIYTQNDDTLYTHLYIGGTCNFTIENENITLHQSTQYPEKGNIHFKLELSKEKMFQLALRIPSWCTNYHISVNGKATDYTLVKGYMLINQTWKDGDQVELNLDMPPHFIESHPQVRANTNKLALQRGPLVYCLEELDNGANLSAIKIRPLEGLNVTFEPDLLGGTSVILAKGERLEEASWQGSLYRPYEKRTLEIELKAIPYYLWGNRGVGEMLVWINK